MDSSPAMVDDGRRAPYTVSRSIAGGQLVAYTAPSPDKTIDNEDSFAAIDYGPAAAVLAIADGAGGLPGGRRASETAIAVLERSLKQSMKETMLLRTAILNGIEEANQAVRDLGNGSATTLTIVTIEDRTARTYQVGDSEALVFGQRGRLRTQTTAHSPTGFAVEAGFLDQRDALTHEERHLVSNFIGTEQMHIDVGAPVTLNPRDTVLLASDGLTDNLHLDEIVELTRKGGLDSALEAVVQGARQRMTGDSATLPNKPDDLTVILFRKPAVR
jgi:serine/threonine protein phosphatase PrpC